MGKKRTIKHVKLFLTVLFLFAGVPFLAIAVFDLPRPGWTYEGLYGLCVYWGVTMVWCFWQSYRWAPTSKRIFREWDREFKRVMVLLVMKQPSLTAKDTARMAVDAASDKIMEKYLLEKDEMALIINIYGPSS